MKRSLLFALALVTAFAFGLIADAGRVSADTTHTQVEKKDRSSSFPCADVAETDCVSFYAESTTTTSTWVDDDSESTDTWKLARICTWFYTCGSDGCTQTGGQCSATDPANIATQGPNGFQARDQKLGLVYISSPKLPLDIGTVRTVSLQRPPGGSFFDRRINGWYVDGDGIVVINGKAYAYGTRSTNGFSKERLNEFWPTPIPKG